MSRLIAAILCKTATSELSERGDFEEGTEEASARRASKYVTQEPDSAPLTLMILADIVVAIVIFA